MKSICQQLVTCLAMSLLLGTTGVAVAVDPIEKDLKRLKKTSESLEPIERAGLEGINTSYGNKALANNTSGEKNSAFGLKALHYNTTGYYNTAIGHHTLRFNTSGYRNVALGNWALQANTTGNENTALGKSAMQANTTGDKNTAIGQAALITNTTGHRNTAIGQYAMGLNTTGFYNTAVGAYSLDANTTGHRNMATGIGALGANTTGERNTATGHAAMYYNTTGKYNTAVGSLALAYNQTGNFNTMVGAEAGYKNVRGSGNIFIGYKAGYNEKGSQKLYIANSSKKTLIYGDFARKTLRIYGRLTATRLSTSSDARLKQDIKPLDNALSTVLQLQGKTYRLQDQPFDHTDIGLIAQDVEKILPEIVSETEDGYKAIAYQSLTAVLIEAMKEQQSQITALQMENQQLQSVMAGQMDALLARVTMLEGVQVAAK